MSGVLPAGANSSFISIIPKMKSPRTFSDFRPISLVSSFYKVISKVLAARLGTVMSDLISEVQHGFRANFQTLDCVMAANEVVHFLNSSGSQGMLLKLDFEKAYDSVEWTFLEDVLGRMGFGQKWKRWILQCVSSNKASVLINGSPSKEFPIGRGLRQGCSLSPFLFNLVGEALHLLLNRALSREIIHDIGNPQAGWSVSHIQYADDILMFLPNSNLDLINTKALLRWFEALSGLKINFSKSALVTINMDDISSSVAAASIGCKRETLPFEYLGSYVGLNAGRLSNWRSVVEKMKKKLASWKGRLLSIGGRITLIRAALRSIPLYNMSIFRMPVGTVNQLEGIMRRFLWSGEEDSRFMSKVSWETVIKPIDHGGLGIESLRTRNDAFLLKWVWQTISGGDKVWMKIVRGQYGFLSLGDFRSNIPNNLSPIWEAIVNTCSNNSDEALAWFRSFKTHLGDGRKCSFWWDGWVSDSPLAILFPRLYEVSGNKYGRVSEFYNDHMGFPIWQNTWLRTLSSDEENDLNDMNILRSSIRLITHKSDSFSWNHGNSGKYSIHSSSSLIHQTRSPSTFDYRLSSCWQAKIPYRILFFSWLVLQQKIASKSFLSYRHIAMADTLCDFCRIQEEDSDHLLLSCSDVSTFWFKIFDWLHIPIVLPDSVTSLWDNWAEVCNMFHKACKPWVKMLIYACFWQLWLRRNKLIFQQKVEPIDVCISKSLISWIGWIRSAEPRFPYDAATMILSSEWIHSWSRDPG